MSVSEHQDGAGDTPSFVPVSDIRFRLDSGMASKRGRPSKGERDLFVTRPSAQLGRAVRASAEREGYAFLSDYIAAVLAEREGLPEYAPRPIHGIHQEVLEISA